MRNASKRYRCCCCSWRKNCNEPLKKGGKKGNEERKRRNEAKKQKVGFTQLTPKVDVTRERGREGVGRSITTVAARWKAVRTATISARNGPFVSWREEVWWSPRLGAVAAGEKRSATVASGVEHNTATAHINTSRQTQVERGSCSTRKSCTFTSNGTVTKFKQCTRNEGRVSPTPVVG